jgi:hypothetical protein
MNVSIGSAGSDDGAAHGAGRRFEKGASRHEGDADAQRHDNEIGFGVVARLKRLIPTIEHLEDGSRETDGEDRRDAELANRAGHLLIVALRTHSTFARHLVPGTLILEVRPISAPGSRVALSYMAQPVVGAAGGRTSSSPA